MTKENTMTKEKLQKVDAQESAAETEAGADRALDGVGYALTVINKSTMAGNACVFQTSPDESDPGILSLAWFSKYVFPTTKVAFSWQIDYNFVWAQTGQLMPGVQFTASQDPEANLSTTNQITLMYDPVNKAYTFGAQGTGPKKDNLYILGDRTIPSISDVAVGIGMSGSGTFAVQARPNIQHTFTPHPKYWLVFGKFTQGEVLDIGEITDAVEINFHPGVYSMTAVLELDNTWSIKPTAEALADFASVRGGKRLHNGGSQSELSNGKSPVAQYQD
jgi:hypothetical protein